MAGLGVGREDSMGTKTDAASCGSLDCTCAATMLLPQSEDAGKTITYVARCDGCAEGWWDGADWDGRGLESRIGPPALPTQEGR